MTKKRIRTRKKDDPEKVKKWQSHQNMREDLKRAKHDKLSAGIRHSAGYAERNRRQVLYKEKLTWPVYEVLKRNRWTSALRPILEAHLREHVIQSTKIP